MESPKFKIHEQVDEILAQEMFGEVNSASTYREKLEESLRLWRARLILPRIGFFAVGAFGGLGLSAIYTYNSQVPFLINLTATFIGTSIGMAVGSVVGEGLAQGVARIELLLKPGSYFL